MVRSFIVLLLLAVCFLAGTLYGMDRNKFDNVAVKDEKIESVEVSNHTKDQMELTEEINEINSAEINEPTHLTEKTASFLGAAVQGFYEVVVQILYQISQLFF